MQRCKVLNNTAKPRGISEEWTVEKKKQRDEPMHSILVLK